MRATGTIFAKRAFARDGKVWRLCTISKTNFASSAQVWRLCIISQNELPIGPEPILL